MNVCFLYDKLVNFSWPCSENGDLTTLYALNSDKHAFSPVAIGIPIETALFEEVSCYIYL